MVWVHEFNRLNWCCFRMVHFVHPRPELGKSKIPHVFPSTRALTSIGSKNPNRPVIVSGKAIYTEIWMDLGCLIITVLCVCVYFLFSLICFCPTSKHLKEDQICRAVFPGNLLQMSHVYWGQTSRGRCDSHTKIVNSAFWDVQDQQQVWGVLRQRWQPFTMVPFGAARSQSVTCSIISQLCIHNSRIQREWLSLETATLERFFTTRMITAVCCLRLT